MCVWFPFHRPLKNQINYFSLLASLSGKAGDVHNLNIKSIFRRKEKPKIYTLVPLSFPMLFSFSETFFFYNVCNRLLQQSYPGP